jgi:hypothetical protein
VSSGLMPGQVGLTVDILYNDIIVAVGVTDMLGPLGANVLAITTNRDS